MRHSYGCNSTTNGRQGNLDDASVNMVIETGNTAMGAADNKLKEKPTEDSKRQPTLYNNKDRNRFRYEVCFDNIVDQEDEYTVTISTELNGRTVTQMVEKFPMGQPDTL